MSQNLPCHFKDSCTVAFLSAFFFLLRKRMRVPKTLSQAFSMSRNLTQIIEEFTICAGKRIINALQKSWKMEIQKNHYS